MSGDPVILTVAATGSIPTRKDNPAIPYTPEEIAEEVFQCYEAGATTVHLHARNPKTGAATADTELFRQYMNLIREKCDIIINITTGGGRVGRGAPRPDRGGGRFQQEGSGRAEQEGKSNEEVLVERLRALRPEVASLNMGTLNAWYTPVTDRVFTNTTKLIETLGKTMMEIGTKPELEIYHSGMLNTVETMRERDALRDPLHLQFVLTGGTGASPTVKDLLHLVESRPPGSTWSACALGRHEFPVAAAAMLLGGHARVGFEDNLHLSRGVLAKSNAELVAKAARIARELGREVATVDEAREILGLKKKR
ncbi:MAG: 3-keto-5-aminohexanoate cleavage protein [Euryarchaeota archaeon]|nr:3-keto-5-aminohexanoate cleavage protein [Euryarchaeota archaeon]